MWQNKIANPLVQLSYVHYFSIVHLFIICNKQLWCTCRQVVIHTQIYIYNVGSKVRESNSVTYKV